MRHCIVVQQQKIQSELDEHPRVTLRKLEIRLQALQSTIFNFMREQTDLIKLSVRWVSLILTSELKQSQKKISQTNLRVRLVHDCSGTEKFLSVLVTSEEA